MCRTLLFRLWNVFPPPSDKAVGSLSPASIICYFPPSPHPLRSRLIGPPGSSCLQASGICCSFSWEALLPHPPVNSQPLVKANLKCHFLIVTLPDPPLPPPTPPRYPLIMITPSSVLSLHLNFPPNLAMHLSVSPPSCSAVGDTDPSVSVPLASGNWKACFLFVAMI